MTVTKILLFLLCAALPTPFFSPSTAGPPAICFPLEIGDHRSLPWGDGPFRQPADYALSNLTVDVVQILNASDHAVVHMETLRRAAIMVGMRDSSAEAKAVSASAQKTRAKLRGEQRQQLIASLRQRALAEFLKQPSDQAPSGRALGLALLDLGYLLGALGQIGSSDWADDNGELERATALCDGDGHVWLGYCLAGFERHNHSFPAPALRKVCRLAASDKTLRANLVATIGVVSGNNSYDELVAWANQQSAEAK